MTLCYKIDDFVCCGHTIVYGWRFGLSQRSCATSDPVSTGWVTVCRRVNHLGM